MTLRNSLLLLRTHPLLEGAVLKYSTCGASMATFLARSLRSIGASGFARLPKKWNVGPRYYTTPSSGNKITSSSNLIVIGGTVVVGVMTYSVSIIAVLCDDV